MRYGHELGEHRPTEDGMVRGAEVRDLERQVLCAEVLLYAEGDRQAYTTYGVCSLAGHDPVEGSSQAVILLKLKSIFRSISVKMMFKLLPRR
jgi:hypothetical protein